MPAGIGPLEVLNKEIKKNHQIYPFISNELVLVLHPDTQLAITDISELATVDVTRFAIADPKFPQESTQKQYWKTIIYGSFWNKN